MRRQITIQLEHMQTAEPPQRLVAASDAFAATLAAAAKDRRQALLMSIHPRYVLYCAAGRPQRLPVRTMAEIARHP